MSKIEAYLQEHLRGDISANMALRQAISRDGSILEILPEIVIYPRGSSDVRKVMRFVWQLAERGHATLPVTARGSGSNTTGASIGSGIILGLTAHMDTIFEFEPRHSLVRLQPGVTSRGLEQALSVYKASWPTSPAATHRTIGGVIADGVTGPLAGRYGKLSRWIDALEVVLANGEMIQTSRLSRREVGRKKGLQTLEGDIYREIDSLIDEHGEIMNKLKFYPADVLGYRMLTEVKGKDGSIDLTPLFVGSQGTLGIIVEAILKTSFLPSAQTVVAAVVGDVPRTRAALNELIRLEPYSLEYLDGGLFAAARLLGRQYDHLNLAPNAGEVVLVVAFDNKNSWLRRRKVTQAHKILDKHSAYRIDGDGSDAQELFALNQVVSAVATPRTKGPLTLPLLDGTYIPPEKFIAYADGIAELGEKYRQQLSIYGRETDNIYYIRPTFDLQRLTERQKVMKLAAEYAELVHGLDGSIAGGRAEGRLHAPFVYAHVEEDIIRLYEKIKQVFDPYGVLNPGVKQAQKISDIAKRMRGDYFPTELPSRVPFV